MCESEWHKVIYFSMTELMTKLIENEQKMLRYTKQFKKKIENQKILYIFRYGL